MHLTTKHHHHEFTPTQRHAKQDLSMLMLYSNAPIYGLCCDVLRCVVLRVVLCCVMMLTVLWFSLFCKVVFDVFLTAVSLLYGRIVLLFCIALH